MQPTTDQQRSTAWLKPTELKFYKGKKRWECLPERLVRGTVGYMGTDRSPDWNLFVVVGYDEASNTCDLVFPRIRVYRGRVMLGQDKLSSKELAKQRMVMGGGGGYASPEQRRVYRKGFKTVRMTGASYTSVTYNVSDLRRQCITDMYHANVKCLRSLDVPLEFCSESDRPWMACDCPPKAKQIRR